MNQSSTSSSQIKIENLLSLFLTVPALTAPPELLSWRKTLSASAPNISEAFTVFPRVLCCLISGSDGVQLSTICLYCSEAMGNGGPMCVCVCVCSGLWGIWTWFSWMKLCLTIFLHEHPALFHVIFFVSQHEHNWNSWCLILLCVYAIYEITSFKIRLKFVFWLVVYLLEK